MSESIASTVPVDDLIPSGSRLSADSAKTKFKCVTSSQASIAYGQGTFSLTWLAFNPVRDK